MFFVFLCASFVSCMYEREKEEGRARVVLLVEKKRKEEKKKGSAFASFSRRSLGFVPIRLSFLSLSLSRHELTLLAKSYLKPEYLSLGFVQSETFSLTAATTCEVVRRPIEVFDVDVGLGGDKLAVAAERLVVATEAVEVIDVDLREEDAMLVPG